MEESLALLEKLKQGSGVNENSTTQSKDEGYVSAELAQAEQASELLAKLPPESPLLQAVEAMAKQQQFDLMQQQSSTTSSATSQQSSNSSSLSQSQSHYNQQSQRWQQQQQQQLQQQQQQQQQKEQEMLYNYFFKTGALPQTAAYAQNAYGLTPEQMKQLYGSTPEQMKQLYGAAAAGNATLDPFNHYYQQYNQFLQMQQQMQNYTSQGSSRSRTQQAQAAAQATASMQNMQAQLEQLAAYNPQLAAMAKWQQEQQQHQQQQQQQQQKQKLQQQQVHQQQQLQQQQQSQHHHQKQSYGSQNQADLSKVQTPVTSTMTASRRPQPSRDSPLRPSQSPRGGGQHFQQDHNIPSATNLKHLPGYPKATPAEASTKASKEAELGISQDLLDSVAGLSKLLPPTSEKGSGTPSSTTAMASTTPGRNSSPSKTPATPVNVTDVTPEHHPSSIRRTSSVASDKDKTFEDLVKKVESSPKISDHKSTPKAGTDKDEASGMSDMNDDYDDMKGGVDYDDYDFDQDEYLPRGGRQRRGQGQVQRGGRGRGRGGAKGNLAKVRPFKSRGRPKAKNVTIDTKNLAKVHRTVAGTDYDFEDEFDDEFGVEKKAQPEVSLKDLREQSKKTEKVLPIYMKTEGGKGKGDDFEFDEMLKNDIIKKPVNKKVNNSRILSNSNRGRPSGRPKRDTRTSNSVEADDFDIEENDEIDSVMDQPEPPKLPKLKLGAMMASKKEKKKSRRESNDSEQTKVPKIKIKLGPKPEAGKPKSEPNDIIKDEKEPEKQASEIDANVKPSPMSSPTKRGSKIDLLAERLLNKNQGSATNDLESIFGPSGVPLDMSGSTDKDPKKSDPIADLKSGSTNEKSELEMIQEELASNTGNTGSGKSGTTRNFIQSSPAGASPHAYTVDGPLKKAINAGKASALEKEKEKTTVTTSFTTSDIPDNYAYPKKHLKLKFKNLEPDLDRHQTSTPPPQNLAQPSNNPSIPTPASSVTSSAPSNVSYHPRMNRKKQLLNQYYGHDVYPAPPSNNGPASSTSSTVINSYDSLTTYAGSSDQPPQPPRPVIKMPKAVASVTSVPTRADYQQQLEANLERKRKREGKGENDLGGLVPESGKGKRKRGRGAKNVEDDSEYRPKTKESQNQSGTANKNDSAAEKMRKTRGKPPKKCLAETEDHEPGDLKAESLKYAEAIRAQFDEPKGANNKGRKKKRKAAATASEAAGENASKTPRLVIKFSKESVNNLKENGGDEYDFVEDAAPNAGADKDKLAANAPNDLKFVDGTVDSALSSVNNSPNSATEVSKVTKLKIKI